MIIEAYSKDKTKYKVGMEVYTPIRTDKNFYIFDIRLNSEDKADTLFIIDSDMSEALNVTANAKNVKVTGNFDPEILKFKRKLAKK